MNATNKQVSYLNPEPGWRLWDSERLNCALFMPDGWPLWLRFSHDLTGEVLDSIKNDHVVEFGPYAVDGSYACFDFEWMSDRIKVEYSTDGDRLVCRCRCTDGDGPISMGVGRGAPFRTELRHQSPSIRLLASGDASHRVAAERLAGTMLDLSQTCYVAASMGEDDDLDIAELDRFVDSRMRRAIAAEQGQSEGWQGIQRTVLWQTVSSPEIELVYTSVGRDVCEYWGGYVLFSWDAFFAGLLSSLFSQELAEANIRAILMQAMPDGMIPMKAARAVSYDRSGPPVGSHCVLEIYRRTANKEFLRQTFGGLLAWHRWYGANRDGNSDGLLEYGSSPKDGPEGSFCLQGAKFESGLDNSHMYDNAHFNTGSATMELIDVGLNSLWAHDAECLSLIALELDRVELAAELEAEYHRIKSLINDVLWNESKNVYLNRYWDGTFSEELSPTLFYPMLAGAPSREMAERMVKKHLLNEGEFWGEYVIPSTPRNHPAFRDGDYWRGRIWGPMNYLVWQGLRRMGFETEARLVAERSLEMFLKGWRDGTRCYEHYSPIDGLGGIDSLGNVHQSFSTYSWGGLLAYMSISQPVPASRTQAPACSPERLV